MKKVFRNVCIAVLLLAVCICAGRFLMTGGEEKDSDRICAAQDDAQVDPEGAEPGAEQERWENVRDDSEIEADPAGAPDDGDAEAGTDMENDAAAGEEAGADGDAQGGAEPDDSETGDADGETEPDDSETGGADGKTEPWEPDDMDGGSQEAGRTSSVYRDRTRGAGKSTSGSQRYEAGKTEDTDRAEPARGKTGYIFMGDSRFYLMNLDCDIESRENFFVVSCPGMGYAWMIVEALPEITSIQNDHPEIGEWVIISGLGVNDLKNVQSYVDTYKVLAKNMSLVLLSVNPVSGQVDPGYSNRKIDAFNKRLRRLASQEKSIKYINSHDYLVHKGYTTTDGIHYDVSTNYDIYLYILNSLRLEG